MVFTSLRWHGLRLSFATWLVLITLACMIPTLAFSVAVVHRLLSASQEQELSTLKRRAASAAETIGRELEHARTTARVVALSNVAVRGDFQGMHTLASRVVANDPRVQLIALVQRDGQRIFSTSRPWGSVAAARPLLDQEASVIDANRVIVSPILPMGREGALVVGIGQPVQVENAERYALRVAIPQAGLGEALRSLRWPADWTVAIVDQRMNIVARSRDEARFLGMPASESLQTHIRDADPEPFTALNKEGVRTLTVLAPVPGSGWWVAVGLPETSYEARVMQPMLWMMGLGILLLVMGSTGAVWLGRALTRQVRSAAEGERMSAWTVRELDHLDARSRHTAAALHDARHDALTGLPARALFIEDAERMKAAVAGQAHTGIAALFIDLDGFKSANDQLGHEAGDRILVRVADAIRRNTRSQDGLGRLGGDEFVVVLTAPVNLLAQVSGNVAQRIVRDVAALGDGMGCSIGVAFTGTEVDIKDLLERADQAMFAAKRAGKNRFVIDPATTKLQSPRDPRG